MKDKIVIITGASAGIGLSTARYFSSKGGYKVYGLNRRIPEGAVLYRDKNKKISSSNNIRTAEDEIKTFHPKEEMDNHPDNETAVYIKENIYYISTDVSDFNGVQASVGEIVSREGKIDILINNAGFGISGAIEFTDLSDAKKQFDVNFFGAFNCIKAVLPYMRQERRGMIISVTSVAGVIPVPFQAFYSATKAAVNALTMTLSNEVRGFKIKATALMPGNVSTGFTDAREKSSVGNDVYKSLDKSVGVMEDEEINGLSPDFIAKIIWKISTKKNPKPLYTTGFLYQVLVVLNKLLPVRFVNYIVGKLYA